MYNPKIGEYIYTTDSFDKESIYKWEAAYYINYNSKKALYALEKIFENYNGSINEKCFYYHVYLDLLFESVGLLINRFVFKDKGNGKEKKVYLEKQAENNRMEYDYYKKCKVLNNKEFRNFIEHIDEKDDELIQANKFYGTFNLIYKGMSDELRKNLLNKNNRQNNLLDIENMKYYITYSGEKRLISYTIDLVKLRNELIEMNKTSQIIWNCVNSNIF